MSKAIPLSEPVLNGKEWTYVKDCLDTGWLSSSGKYVDQFEKDICDAVQSKYAVALNSGTSALHIGLKVLGVEAGDEVIVPTVTFIAPINTVRYVGAEPIFMDCDEYYNLDVDKTIAFIKNETDFRDGYTVNTKTQKIIRAMIPVHIFGNAVDLEALLALCKDRNIKIIEDATESLGSYYNRGKLNKKYTGTIGDVGCLSFNGNKIITTGGGGMLLTQNKALADKVHYLANQAKDDGLRYVHNEVGYNFRLTNVQAAIGVAQASSLPEILKKKKDNYQYYQTLLQDIEGLTLAETPDYAESNYWMYALRIDSNIYGMTKDELLEKLIANNIGARPMFYLNHLQMPYKNNQAYEIEKAHIMLDQTLNIPCGFGLTEDEIEQIVELLRTWKT